MFYKFDHSDIIEDYEILIKFSKIVGSKLDKKGKNVFDYIEKDINIAYFQVNPNEINENNGFESGDLKVFCRTNQENILAQNDKIPAFGTEYIIKNEIPLEYSDYKVFIARRIVDSNGS